MAHSLRGSKSDSSGEYEGKCLVDRLLLHYSAKFDGKRPKAVKYAQKLLDLGHIEGLGGCKVFNDGSDKYRWTDVATVVNSKTKTKSDELSPSIDVAKLKSDRPKRTVKISIETDDCEDTEIRAHIKTIPHKNNKIVGVLSHETRQGTSTHILEGCPRKKMLSFTSETSKTEEIMRIVPITPGVTQIMEDVNENEEHVYDTLKPSEEESNAIERIGKQEFESRVLKFKSATQPTIVTFSASATADSFYTESKDQLKSDELKVENNSPEVGSPGQNTQLNTRQLNDSKALVNDQETRKTPTSRQSNDLHRNQHRHEGGIEKSISPINGSKNLPFDLKSDIQNSGLSPRRQRRDQNGHEEVKIYEQRENSYDTTPPSSPELSPIPSFDEKPTAIKPLFWRKISNDTTCGKSFWDDIKGNISFDKEEFAKLFPKAPIVPRNRKIKQDQTSGNVEGGILKVLTTERSRQVAIRANSVHLAIEDIHDAIVNLDDELLDTDAIQALYDIRPTQNELDRIEVSIKKHPEAILDKPEQLLTMLAMISNLDERLQSWLFVRKFDDRSEDIEDQLTTVTEACQSVMKNSTIKHALEIILTVGNFMNVGTARGKAFGFYFDILPKIKDVKSSNGNLNLLKYIVKKFIEENKFQPEFSKSEQGVEDREEVDVDYLLPSQQLLRKAAAVSMDEILQNLEDISSEADNIEDELFPKIIKGSTCAKDIDLFSQKYSTHLRNVFDELDILHECGRSTMKTVDGFLKYFLTENEKLEKETLSSILSNLEQFCEDFRSMWRLEMREQAKEVLSDIAKSKTQRNITSVSNTPSSLKRRFMEKRQRENNIKTLPLYVKKESPTREDSRHVEKLHFADEGVKNEYVEYAPNNLHAVDPQVNLYLGKARKNSLEIEERLRSMKINNTMRLKQARLERRTLLKAKTC